MAYKAKFEQWIPIPLERAFRFFGNPANLARIMPPWMAVRVEDVWLVPPPDQAHNEQFAGEGSVLRISFRAIPLSPLRIRSVAHIARFALDQSFEDAHSDRLFKIWHHRHEFASERRRGRSGTVVRDVISYELRFGPFSSVINQLFIKPQMRRTFEYRQRVAERLLT